MLCDGCRSYADNFYCHANERMQPDVQPLRIAYQDRIVDSAAILTVELWDEHFEIEAVIFSSGTMTAEALITGNADLATMGDAVAVNLAARYPDRIVIVGIHGEGSSRHGLVSRTDKPQTIAVKFGTSTHAALSARLDYQPKLVDLSPSVQLSALSSGEVDALAASEPTPGIAAAADPALKVTALEIEGRRFPVVLVVSKKAWDERKDEIMHVIKRLDENGRLLNSGAGPREFEILSRVTGLDASVIEDSLKLHHYGFYNPEGYLPEFEELSNFLLEQGKIQEVPDWEHLIGR